MEASYSRAQSSEPVKHPQSHSELITARNSPAQGHAIMNQQLHPKKNNPDIHSRVTLAREILETGDLQAALARMTLSGSTSTSEENSGSKGKEQAQSPAAGTQEPQRKRKARADSPMEGVEEQELKQARRSLSDADVHQASQAQTKPVRTHRGTRGGTKNRLREMKKAKRMELSAHASAIMNAQQTTPNDDIMTTFSQRMERKNLNNGWLVDLLYRDLKRLEEINKVPGLADTQDAEMSAGLAHIVAAMKLEEARAKLEGTDAMEFLEHHLLDMEEDLTHLRHKKEVLETSVRKLFKYLEFVSPTKLGHDVRQRVAAVLGSLPSA